MNHRRLPGHCGPDARRDIRPAASIRRLKEDGGESKRGTGLLGRGGLRLLAAAATGGTATVSAASKKHGRPATFPRRLDMLTMAILAMIGAFTFGFVLCGMFAVGATADRSGRDHGHDSLEVSLLRAALLDPRPLRHPDPDSFVSSSSTRSQGRFPHSLRSFHRGAVVPHRRGARRRPSSQP